MNERARSQDFLALYNLTTVFKNDVINQLTSIQTNNNSSVSNLNSEIQATEMRNNLTVTHLEGSTIKAGNVIKFNEVKFSVGISNLSTYKSNGKFICETSGLYMISTSIATDTAGNPEYGIIHNGTYISRTEIGQESSSAWRTGTSVVSRYLDVKDTIWVNAMGDVTPEASIWFNLQL
ncbi:unnamed protein product [Mytilus edulis]|uniref:C1q domain-containing protein n=1 Tax=Mytilus edulis TaxID=6550 RepID=A0A8S3PWV0_MYTED|nr:unnamed protein product [Mytilus edulis]